MLLIYGGLIILFYPVKNMLFYTHLNILTKILINISDFFKNKKYNKTDNQKKYLKPRSNILVISSNKKIVDFITCSLKDDYRLKIVNNSLVNIKKMLETPNFNIDLIIFDPLTDGNEFNYNFCELLSRKKDLIGIPYIIFTDKYANSKEKLKGLSLGAMDYKILKEIGIDEFNAKITSIIKNQALFIEKLIPNFLKKRK